MDRFEQGAVLFVHLVVENELHGAAVCHDPCVAFVESARAQREAAEHLTGGRVPSRSVNGVMNRLVSIDLTAVRFALHCRIVIESADGACHSGNAGQTCQGALPTLRVRTYCMDGLMGSILLAAKAIDSLRSYIGFLVHLQTVGRCLFVNVVECLWWILEPVVNAVEINSGIIGGLSGCGTGNCFFRRRFGAGFGSAPKQPHQSNNCGEGQRRGN